MALFPCKNYAQLVTPDGKGDSLKKKKHIQPLQWSWMSIARLMYIGMFNINVHRHSLQMLNPASKCMSSLLGQSKWLEWNAQLVMLKNPAFHDRFTLKACRSMGIKLLFKLVFDTVSRPPSWPLGFQS